MVKLHGIYELKVSPRTQSFVAIHRWLSFSPRMPQPSAPYFVVLSHNTTNNLARWSLASHRPRPLLSVDSISGSALGALGDISVVWRAFFICQSWRCVQSPQIPDSRDCCDDDLWTEPRRWEMCKRQTRSKYLEVEFVSYSQFKTSAGRNILDFAELLGVI